MKDKSGENYRIFGIVLIASAITILVLSVLYFNTQEFSIVSLPAQDSVQDIGEKNVTDIISVEIHIPGEHNLLIYEEGPTNDLVGTIPGSLADGLTTVYGIQEWTQQLLTKYRNRPDIMKVHNFPLGGKFAFASPSPNKDFIIIGVKTSIGGSPGPTVTGSINLVTGELVMDTISRFSGNVEDIQWMDDEKFVLITDSELSLCNIAISDFARSCQFFLMADDIKKELGANTTNKFIPDFRDIRWNNEERTQLAFTTNGNIRSRSLGGAAYWVIRDFGTDLTNTGFENRIDPATELLGIKLGCDEAEHPADCFTLARNLFLGGVGTSFVVVRNDLTDKELGDYFTKHFPGMEDVSVSNLSDVTYTIRRGNETIIGTKDKRLVSFRANVEGDSEANIILVTIGPNSFGATSLKGIIIPLGTQRIVENVPLYLVKDQNPYLLVKHVPLPATCEPFLWNAVLYEITDKEVQLVWSNQYYKNGRLGTSSTIENTFTEISFIDLDGDGNQEIIQEGITSFCTGPKDICYRKDCTIISSSFEGRRIFQWNSISSKFEEQG